MKFIKKNKSFVIFSIMAIAIVLIGVFAPMIATHDPTEAVLKDALQAPSSEHLFGTDKMGRDVFSRVIYGTRISLSSSLILVAIILVIGSIMGVLAGYFGGIVDTVNMMISFPGMVLAIAVAGILGASINNAIIAIAAVSWTKYARLARSLVLKIRHKDYVYAAILTGSKTPYMLVRYMLPNAIPMLVITAATDIGSMMLELAGLSFLGFGAQPPLAERGLMLNEGRVYMQNAPWCMLAPGIAIFIVVVVFNLLGDSLRDVLDPRDE